LTGALSEPGEWGHMGMYPRQLTVTKVESFAPVTLNGDVPIGDCCLSAQPEKRI
jgi:hypothetical protein